VSSGSSAGTKWERTRVFTGLLGNPSDFFDGGVMGEDALLEAAGIGDRSDQAIDRLGVHRLVHQHIGAPRQGDEILGTTGVTRDDYRAVRHVEPVGKGEGERGMIHQRRGDPDLGVLVEHAGCGDLMGPEQGSDWYPPLIAGAEFDVHRIQCQVLLGHPPEWRRTPAIDRRLEARGPGQQQEIAVVGVVVGMMMGHQHVAERSERYVGQGELPGHAVATVDHIGRVIDDDGLRRCGPRLSWTGTAGRAEKDESGSRWFARLRRGD
jgi:hypothetical protein